MRKFINLMALAALLFVPSLAKAQLSLPVSMDFENETTYNTWTVVNGATDYSGNPATTRYNGEARNGSYCFRFFYNTNPPQYLISPELAPLTDSAQVEFWYKAYNEYYTESFVLGWSSTTTDASAFTWGTEVTTNNTSYQKFEGFVPAGTKYVCIKYTANDQFYLFIDDILIQEPPTCLPVTDLAASNVTSDGLTLSWTDALNTSASYSIDYWKNGGDTNTVTATDTFYTFSGLDANTGYNFSVKAVCSASDESIPVTALFGTACGGSTCELTIHTWADYNYSYYWPTVTLYQNGIEVASVSGGPQSVSVCSTDTVIALYTEPTYDYSTPYASILDGGGSELFNSAVSSLSTGDTVLTISTPCPSCIPPMDLTVNTADQNSITIGWTPRSGATQFAVYLDGEEVNGNIIDTFYTFTGLNANTAYTLGVQAICATDDSSNIATLVARTECGAMTLPFSDDFDSYDNGFWPPCWHRLRAYGTDPSVNNQFHHSGTQSMFLLAANDTTLFCTPNAIPTSGDNIFVRYHAFLTWASYYTETKWIKAGVMTDTSDMSTFIALDSVEYHNFNDIFEEREFNTANLNPTATYWVAWMFYSTNNGYNTNRGAIDDVYISEIPSCLRVPAVVFDSATSDELTFHWDDNGSTGYTVYYWADGETDTLTASTSDTTITLTGLDGLTQYHLYVVANCSGGDAEPSPEYSFATACADATCNITLNMVDSYGDGWNGNYIQIYQAGVMVGQGTIASGSSATETIEVCSSAAVELHFVKGSYATEMQGTVNDGSGAVIFTIANMNDHSTGDVLATVATPCPNCIMPMNLAVDTVTATDATIHWVAQDDQSSWFVILDTNEAITVTDTFYTFTNLEARTRYTAYVATDCGGDTSTYASITFMTDCSAGSCEIIVTATASYSYSTYCPTVHVWQNGFDVASVNASTDTISVCTGMPVALIYEEPSYSYSYYTPSVTILDGGDEEVFNSSTSNYSTGDTLVLLANACPSCLKPTGVMATAIDSTEISFAWNEDGSVSNYLVSFNGGTETVGYNGTDYYSGLTPNTTYTFSVRAVCAPGDTSNARVITVRTACGQMAIPFIEGFESYADGDVPTCWNVVSGNPEVEVSASDAHTGNASLYMYGNDALIATSRVPLPGDSIYVSFWADYNYGILEAGVMTNPLFDTTFVSLLTVTSTSGYELFEFNTSSLSNDSSYYVAFRFSSPYYSANIDDINIRLDEGCLTPTNLTVNPTASGTTLTWHDGTGSGNFVVEYCETGSSWSTPVDVYDTTYTLMGLNASSQYEVRVGFLCGNDTLWASTSFQTPCGLMALPYFEDFDAYANDVMPPCWIWSSTHCTHWDGGVFLRSYHGGGSEYVVLPQLDGNISKLKVEFDAKVGTPAENDGILIGVTNAAGTLLAWLDTIQDPNFSRNNHVHKTVYFTNYSNIMPVGAERVAFAQYRNWGEWALIDNINIEELPDCYPVDNLVGHNLNDIENTTFTWHPQGTASEWQVYVDTVTVDIDSLANLPDSLFTNVYDTTYTIPIGMIQGGGIYNFFVRSTCSATDHSGWVKNEFGAGTIIMNNSSVADTVEGCGFVVYDNGGPIPGYLPNSNSALVIRTENVGSQLQIFGGKFGFGSSPATLTVYDGEGTTGTVLYTYNIVDGRDTLIDTVLATTTTGSMTITFVVSGNMCHTGYELYIRCTEGALCPRPTELQAEMTSENTADVSWNSSASNFNFYYRIHDAATWVRIPTTVPSVSLTGLVADTTYDMYVVAICSATDSSTASVMRQLSTHYEIPVIPCNAPTSLTAINITANSAILSWTNGGTETAWTLNYNGTEIAVNTNPYTLTGLTPNTTYVVKVKANCDVNSESEWSSTTSFTTQSGDPQVTYYTVTVLSNDPTMGSVSGGGSYAENSQAILNAINNEGYHFVSWSNGETAASISITVTSDTTLTATFAANDPGVTYYTVTLSSNNPSWGTVTGAGSYEAGSSIEIKAISSNGYHFVNWSDNNTDSIRTIVVNSDINLTATFAQNVGIDDVNSANITLYPNPASSTVTLSGIEGQATVTVVDMNGRVVTAVETQPTASNITIDLTGYAQGAYFVRIVGNHMNAIRKLIVK